MFLSFWKFDLLSFAMAVKYQLCPSAYDGILGHMRDSCSLRRLGNSALFKDGMFCEYRCTSSDRHRG